MTNSKYYYQLLLTRIKLELNSSLWYLLGNKAKKELLVTQDEEKLKYCHSHKTRFLYLLIPSREFFQNYWRSLPLRFQGAPPGFDQISILVLSRVGKTSPERNFKKKINACTTAIKICPTVVVVLHDQGCLISDHDRWINWRNESEL